MARFRAEVCVLSPWILSRVPTTHSSVAPSSGSMITTSSNCGTHASAVYIPARLVGKHCVSLCLYFPVVDIPPPSDNDCPLQLCSFALSLKDGEIIHCGILFEGTAYRILRVNVSAQCENLLRLYVFA